VSAFLRPIDGAFWLRGARAVVLGAGGAARSVAAALSSAGAQVTISARRADQAQQVAALTGAAVGEWPPPPGTWDLLVNATSAGTAAAAGLSPLPDDYRFDGRVVYDLIYSPPVTRLLADAARAGCRTIGGLDMLVAQALAQFEWWTGRRPAERVMRDAALARLTEMEPR
jgi:shikimate 5-dehydrogenase